MKLGNNVSIFDPIVILNPENIDIGDNSRIDSFVKLEGGSGIRIGKYVHISSFCSILGGGNVFIDDFTAIAQGVRLITGVGSSFEAYFNIDLPEDHPLYKRRIGEISIGKYCLISVNSVIFPNISIGDGAVIGAGSIVTKNIPPWTLAFGNPIKIIRKYK